MKLQCLLPLMLTLAACAAKPKAENKPMTEIPPAQVPAASAPAAAATDHIDSVAQSSAEKNLSREYGVFDYTPLPAKPADAAPAPKAEEETAKVTLVPVKKTKGFDAKVSLSWLEHGNKRFVKGNLRKDGQTRKDIARVASVQNPHAIVLASSDSRVPPELVFDQKLGEIFVVRTAGEALDRSAIGSLEYALKNFGARLVVILGNSGAGHELWARPDGIAEDLKHVSPAIRDAVEHDGVLLQPAVYDLKTGAVTFQ
jgi:carbonic anhydrase